MKEDIIKFKTAKLAKEKGFDWRCKLFYNIKDGLITTNLKLDLSGGAEYARFIIDKQDTSCLIPAPTQSLLQKWLRDVHKIHVSAWCNASGWGWEIERTNGTHISIMDIDGDIKGTNPESGMFSTYEEALEEGLYQSLLLIK